MPNDCLNIVQRMHHPDAQMMERLWNALHQDPPVLLADLVPCPQNTSRELHWGTKWDVYDVMITDDAGPMTFSFHTAWGPPLAAYAHLRAMGFAIDALFMESGMGFCGHWKDGEERWWKDTNSREVVPAEFHFYFFDEDEDEDEDEDGPP